MLRARALARFLLVSLLNQTDDVLILNENATVSHTPVRIEQTLPVAVASGRLDEKDNALERLVKLGFVGGLE